MGTALPLTGTVLAVLFAAFLVGDCLRIIGPPCTPVPDLGPRLVNDGAFDGPPPESPGATSARRTNDTPTLIGVAP